MSLSLHHLRQPLYPITIVIMNGTDGNGTEVDTSSPSLAPNKCQEFEPGDIVIFVMTSGK